MLNITLLDLPEDVARPISKLLLQDRHTVMETAVDETEDVQRSAVVFVSGDQPEFRETIRRLRESNPEVKVIVATRLPDDRKWIDALEAGAADYCGAPFETFQIRWMLNSVCKPAVAAAG
jgi:DNA-binding response OmpR family regulator